MRLTKEFKDTLKQLEILRGDIEQHISIILDDREEEFDNRSERWQESQRGDEFQDKTLQLDNLKDEIEYFFGEIEEKIFEIKDL